MAKRSKKNSLSYKEMDLKDAEREFNRRSSRGSKYDDVVSAAEKLGKGKALIVENLSYSEVTGLRKRIADFLGDDWNVSATKADKDKNTYSALVHRKK